MRIGRVRHLTLYMWDWKTIADAIDELEDPECSSKVFTLARNSKLLKALYRFYRENGGGIFLQWSSIQQRK